MASRLAPARLRWLVLLLVPLLVAPVLGSIPEILDLDRDGVAHARPVTSLTLDQLGDQLQACDIMLRLTAHKRDAGSSEATAPASGSPAFAHRLTGFLFPWTSPAANALLATVYISGPPNLLLAVLPPGAAANPAALRTMVAFAVGGLLGDTLFHLLPEVFIGEDDPDRARAVLVEPRRNLLLGAAILVGFVVFVAIDKAMRIGVAGADTHSHHHHGHGLPAPSPDTATATAVAVGLDGADGTVARQRRQQPLDSAATQAGREASSLSPACVLAEPSRGVKMGAYLNLIADFTHNITDGLAMSASFYASPTIGATTAVAVFFHEIPHEIGDFALLVQSGFSRRSAVAAQFVTALGALLGTVIGICVHELGGGAGAAVGLTGGILGTSLTWGDMLLPFTAGTFLYVGTVAVIPELLETGPDKLAELRSTAVQFLAMAAGAAIMFLISW